MIHARFLLFIVPLFMFACSKNNTKSRTALLTAYKWKYESYTEDANNGPMQVYNINNIGNNQQDLSKSRMIFVKDGTYHEVFATGYVFDGTWNFIENETKVKVVSTGGNYTHIIRLLDEGHFTWYDSTLYGGTEGAMIPE